MIKQEGIFIVGLDVSQLRREFRFELIVPIISIAIVYTTWIFASGSLSDWATTVVFILLWKCYQRMLNVSANEYKALSLYSLPWEKVVLYKNIAVILLTTFIYFLLTVILIYFYPQNIPPLELFKSNMFFFSLLFPLLAVVNIRCRKGLELERNPPEMIANLIAIVLILGIPGRIMLAWKYGLFPMVIYSFCGVFFWYVWSIPIASKKLRQRGCLEC
jgi:hypothetical protein